jgi:hypothetical protein
MIQIKEQTVTVKTGQHRKGTVGLRAENNTLTIKNLINEVEIGAEWEDSDVSEEPKVVLEFNSIASVEALQSCLDTIKNNLIAAVYSAC